MSPAEHSVSENVTLSGSRAAYAGNSHKTTNDDHGGQFDRIHLRPRYPDVPLNRPVREGPR
ncbi:hypothetical protein QNO09_14860 [Streptomyces sp. 378]|uniref:hypothetical protein n=1 Tax=Streptomyces sp. 378 TaxID=3049412 RepID=UPI0024C3E5DB|nr:hypothetical protein [Streptomyces sp. 378]MDK1344569.1 hypothetical protein [Streptomyces sp. 378]